MKNSTPLYMKNFTPYALAAFLVGIVGGFASMLGPAFVSDIGIAYNNTTYTALATAVSSAALAPVFGKLTDSVGRKRMLFIGLFIYTLGNLLTSAASSLRSMIPARFIVGAGTAAITPVVISYIVTEFPQDKVGRGFSLYMLISSSAVIFGPTLGGIIINSLGWRVMMLLCTGICIAVSSLCILLLRNEQSPNIKAFTDFDITGSALVLVFFGLFVCIPTIGQNFGIMSVWLWGVVILSLIALFILIYAERRAKNPVLLWPFMKTKTFVLTVIALFLTQGLMQANMTDMIVFVNYTQPENTLISGYAISIMYLGMSLGSVIIGPLADRTEPKRVLIFSLLLTSVGCLLMLLFTEKTSVFLLAACLGITGFALGANASVFMKIVLSGQDHKTAGAASGTYGLFRDLAAPFGVAVLVPLFTNRITALENAGINSAASAVSAIKLLGAVEFICVLCAVVAVIFLPQIHHREGKNEIER
ncbi:MAG: MFS transporter [Anaerofustis stercorihominis]|nr:MFS transporter [Anaerofustis stercorihominis]